MAISSVDTAASLCFIPKYRSDNLFALFGGKLKFKIVQNLLLLIFTELMNISISNYSYYDKLKIKGL